MTTETGEDAKVTQKTKVKELKDIIEQIRSVSIDIRDKTQVLASAPSPDEDKEVTSEDTGNVLLGNLCRIRSILQEAYSALSVFV